MLILQAFRVSGYPKSRHPDTQMSGYPDIRVSGHLDIQVSVYPGIRITGYLDIWISKYPDTRISGYAGVEVFLENFRKDY